MVFSAVGTVRAVQILQQQRTLTREGDVRTIRPWMTIPYIAHVYHVPANYLYQSLHIPYSYPRQHIPLHMLAARSRRPLSEVVHEVQNAIIIYRKQHPPHHLQKHGKQVRMSTNAIWHVPMRRSLH
jgi:hypothetical protein